MKSRRPHIVVFFGGDAAGRDLSSETGFWVCQFIPRDQYDVTPVHVQADGKWQVPLGSLPRHGGVEKMMEYLYRGITALAPTAALERLITRPVSAFFSVMRGRGGDDGSLHSVGQLLDIKVIGSPALACQQTHNKRLSHTIMRDVASVPFASFYGPATPAAEVAADVQHSFEFPLFIKPVSQEGSAGAEHVQTLAELPAAVARAQQFGEIMVQERARGTELSVSLIDGGHSQPLVLPPTIVIPRHATYYDYLAKRRPGRVTLQTPDTDSNSLLLEAEAIARDVYTELGCRGYASMDFVADDASIDLLEVNTVPVVSAANPFIHQLSAAHVNPNTWLDQLVRQSL
jgi:D-alanine--D-alanine ligase